MGDFGMVRITNVDGLVLTEPLQQCLHRKYTENAVHGLVRVAHVHNPAISLLPPSLSRSPTFLLSSLLQAKPFDLHGTAHTHDALDTLKHLNSTGCDGLQRSRSSTQRHNYTFFLFSLSRNPPSPSSHRIHAEHTARSKPSDGLPFKPYIGWQGCVAVRASIPVQHKLPSRNFIRM